MTRVRHRDAFVVEAISGKRFNVALERFLAGRPFEFREVSFAMAPDGTVVVAVDTSWSLSNVTVETATTDFELGQSALRELVSSSGTFASAVHGHPIRYELIEDNGNGSILLCALQDGIMTWAARMPMPVKQAPSGNPQGAQPAEVIAATVPWLNEMSDGLVALAKIARGLDPPLGPALALAVSEVGDRIAHFRFAL